MTNPLISIAQRQKAELPVLLGRAHIQREQAVAFHQALPSPLVKVIIGPRRAGKSSLAMQVLREERLAYFNFEDELLPPQVDGDELIAALRTVYGDYTHIFFDEIQNVPRWEVLLNRLHRLGVNLVVTGSNSKLLSQEFGSSLTGRQVALTLLPFSYREFCAANASQKSTDSLIHLYLHSGGYPEVVLGRIDDSSYLKALFESIVVRDIVQRYKMRNIAALRELLRLFYASVGSRFSARSLERAIRGELSIATIQKYLRYAEEAYLVQYLEVFSLSTRARLRADRKGYAIDNGLYRAVHMSLESNIGVLLENAVYIELIRRGYVPNETLFYINLPDSKGEVDFFLKDDSTLVQVCAHLSAEKTKQREVRGLIRAAKLVSAKSMIIITLAERATISHDNYVVEVMPIADWLQQSAG